MIGQDTNLQSTIAGEDNPKGKHRPNLGVGSVEETHLTFDVESFQLAHQLLLHPCLVLFGTNVGWIRLLTSSLEEAFLL